MATTQYIGARYVPLFAEPLDWNSDTVYEALTIVYYAGNSYTSRQAVPKGIDITNEKYWALTGNYNAQIEAYRKEVKAFDGRITENAQKIADEVTRAMATDSELKTLIEDEIKRAGEAEAELAWVTQAHFNHLGMLPYRGDNGESSSMQGGAFDGTNAFQYSTYDNESGAGELIKFNPFTGVTINTKDVNCFHGNSVCIGHDGNLYISGALADDSSVDKKVYVYDTSLNYVKEFSLDADVYCLFYVAEANVYCAYPKNFSTIDSVLLSVYDTNFKKLKTMEIGGFGNNAVYGFGYKNYAVLVYSGINPYMRFIDIEDLVDVRTIYCSNYASNYFYMIEYEWMAQYGDKLICGYRGATEGVYSYASCELKQPTVNNGYGSTIATNAKSYPTIYVDEAAAYNYGRDGSSGKPFNNLTEANSVAYYRTGEICLRSNLTGSNYLEHCKMLSLFQDNTSSRYTIAKLKMHHCQNVQISYMKVTEKLELDNVVLFYDVVELDKNLELISDWSSYINCGNLPGNIGCSLANVLHADLGGATLIDNALPSANIFNAKRVHNFTYTVSGNTGLAPLNSNILGTWKIGSYNQLVDFLVTGTTYNSTIPNIGTTTTTDTVRMQNSTNNKNFYTVTLDSVTGAGNATSFKVIYK